MKRLLLPLMSAFVVVATAGFAAHSCFAQDTGTVEHRRTIIESNGPVTAQDNTSSSTVVEQRGVMGIKESNVFAPKYKEKLNTYAEQIQMGLTKGWLTQDQADHFSRELDRLRKLEADVAAQNYAKPGLDNLEKQVTQYNIDFTNATNTPAKPAVSAPVTPAPVAPTSVAPTSVAPTPVTPTPKAKASAVHTVTKSAAKPSAAATKASNARKKAVPTRKTPAKKVG